MASRCLFKILRFKSARCTCRNYGYVHVPKKVPPHLLGPGGVWRKCYEVHPYSEIGGVLQKYQFLTKTLVLDGLPDIYEKFVQLDEDFVDDLTQRAAEFLSNRSQHVTTHFKRSEVADGLLQSLMVPFWQLGSKYPHIIDSTFTRSPKVETYWRNKGINYICFSSPMNALFTSSPLQLFAGSESAFEDTSPPLTEYLPFTIGLFERSYDQIEVSGGCKRQGPYPFSHTLFMFNRTKNTTEQTHAHALMSMFAQTAAQTIQNGFKLDQDLIFPLSCQAVLTDGRKFSFACFQLNTLDFRRDSKSTRRNFLWIGPTVDLYEYVSPSGEVVCLNNYAMRLLGQFVLNKPLRKRPPHSGFMIDVLEKQAVAMRRKMKKRELQTKG